MDIKNFLGNHQARVDDKFRLKLPAEFKRIVDEIYGPEFYITSETGRRAQIFPMRCGRRIWQGLRSCRRWTRSVRTTWT